MAALGELPVDAWPAITRCLTGVDLFELARASRWSWQLLSQDVYWRERLSSDCSSDIEHGEGATASALQRYVRAYSFKFHGLCRYASAAQRSGRGSCAQVPAFCAVFVQQQPPITFDTWFCLLDGDEGGKTKNAIYNGGILFGAQSVAHGDSRWAYRHQQFALVSSERTLYCSVVDQKPAIASNLDFNRWYHLALTYGNQTQRVYFDGQLVSTMVADLHSEWSHLRCAQVGTGCITAVSMNFPRPRSCGWYPFCGLIDQFRMWKRELSGEDIQALAQGRSEFVLRGCQFSLRTPQLAYPPNNIISRVSCSRPKEKRVVILLSPRSKQPRRKSDSDQESSSSSRQPGLFQQSMLSAFGKLRSWEKPAHAAS